MLSDVVEPVYGDCYHSPQKLVEIAPLDILSKLLSSMIRLRLGLHLKSVGLAKQSGSMSSHRCVDAVATPKIALQSFKDLIKAFDSLNLEMLWKILAKYGIPEPLVNVIMEMYTLRT
jgi:hypothetical protein